MNKNNLNPLVSKSQPHFDFIPSSKLNHRLQIIKNQEADRYKTQKKHKYTMPRTFNNTFSDITNTLDSRPFEHLKQYNINTNYLSTSVYDHVRKVYTFNNSLSITKIPGPTVLSAEVMIDSDSDSSRPGITGNSEFILTNFQDDDSLNSDNDMCLGISEQNENIPPLARSMQSNASDIKRINVPVSSSLTGILSTILSTKIDESESTSQSKSFIVQNLASTKASSVVDSDFCSNTFSTAQLCSAEEKNYSTDIQDLNYFGEDNHYRKSGQENASADGTTVSSTAQFISATDKLNSSVEEIFPFLEDADNYSSDSEHQLISVDTEFGYNNASSNMSNISKTHNLEFATEEEACSVYNDVEGYSSDSGHQLVSVSTEFGYNKASSNTPNVSSAHKLEFTTKKAGSIFHDAEDDSSDAEHELISVGRQQYNNASTNAPNINTTDKLEFSADEEAGSVLNEGYSSDSEHQLISVSAEYGYNNNTSSNMPNISITHKLDFTTNEARSGFNDAGRYSSDSEHQLVSVDTQRYDNASSNVPNVSTADKVEFTIDEDNGSVLNDEEDYSSDYEHKLISVDREFGYTNASSNMPNISTPQKSEFTIDEEDGSVYTDEEGYSDFEHQFSSFSKQFRYNDDSDLSKKSDKKLNYTECAVSVSQVQNAFLPMHSASTSVETNSAAVSSVSKESFLDALTKEPQIAVEPKVKNSLSDNTKLFSNEEQLLSSEKLNKNIHAGSKISNSDVCDSNFNATPKEKIPSNLLNNEDIEVLFSNVPKRKQCDGEYSESTIMQESESDEQTQSSKHENTFMKNVQETANQNIMDVKLQNPDMQLSHLNSKPCAELDNMNNLEYFTHQKTELYNKFMPEMDDVKSTNINPLRSNNPVKTDTVTNTTEKISNRNITTDKVKDLESYDSSLKGKHCEHLNADISNVGKKNTLSSNTLKRELPDQFSSNKGNKSKSQKTSENVQKILEIPCVHDSDSENNLKGICSEHSNSDISSGDKMKTLSSITLKRELPDDCSSNKQGETKSQKTSASAHKVLLQIPHVDDSDSSFKKYEHKKENTTRAELCSDMQKVKSSDKSLSKISNPVGNTSEVTNENVNSASGSSDKDHIPISEDKVADNKISISEFSDSVKPYLELLRKMGTTVTTETKVISFDQKAKVQLHSAKSSDLCDQKAKVQSHSGKSGDLEKASNIQNQDSNPSQPGCSTTDHSILNQDKTHLKDIKIETSILKGIKVEASDVYSSKAYASPYQQLDSNTSSINKKTKVFTSKIEKFYDESHLAIKNELDKITDVPVLSIADSMTIVKKNIVVTTYTKEISVVHNTDLSNRTSENLNNSRNLRDSKVPNLNVVKSEFSDVSSEKCTDSSKLSTGQMLNVNTLGSELSNSPHETIEQLLNNAINSEEKASDIHVDSTSSTELSKASNTRDGGIASKSNSTRKTKISKREVSDRPHSESSSSMDSNRNYPQIKDSSENNSEFTASLCSESTHKVVKFDVKPCMAKDERSAKSTPILDHHTSFKAEKQENQDIARDDVNKIKQSVVNKSNLPENSKELLDNVEEEKNLHSGIESKLCVPSTSSSIKIEPSSNSYVHSKGYQEDVTKIAPQLTSDASRNSFEIRSTDMVSTSNSNKGISFHQNISDINSCKSVSDIQPKTAISGMCFPFSTACKLKEKVMQHTSKGIRNLPFQIPGSRNFSNEITLTPILEGDPSYKNKQPCIGKLFPFSNSSKQTEANMTVAAKGIENHPFQLPISDAEITLNPVATMDIDDKGNGNHPLQSSGAEITLPTTAIPGVSFALNAACKQEEENDRKEIKNFPFQIPISQSFGKEITLTPIVEENFSYKNKKSSKGKHFPFNTSSESFEADMDIVTKDIENPPFNEIPVCESFDAEISLNPVETMDITNKGIVTDPLQTSVSGNSSADITLPTTAISGMCFPFSIARKLMEITTDSADNDIRNLPFEIPVSQRFGNEITLTPVVEENFNYKNKQPSEGKGFSFNTSSKPIEADMDISANDAENPPFETAVSESFDGDISLNPVALMDIFAEVTANRPLKTPVSQSHAEITLPTTALSSIRFPFSSVSKSKEMVLDNAAEGIRNHPVQVPVSQSIGDEFTSASNIEENLNFKNMQPSKEKGFSLSSSNKPVEAHMDVEGTGFEKHPFQVSVSKGSDADVAAKGIPNHPQIPVFQSSGAEISIPASAISSVRFPFSTCKPKEKVMENVAKDIRNLPLEIPFSQSFGDQITLTPVVKKITSYKNKQLPKEKRLAFSTSSKPVEEDMDVVEGTERHAFQVPVSESSDAEITLPTTSNVYFPFSTGNKPIETAVENAAKEMRNHPLRIPFPQSFGDEITLTSIGEENVSFKNKQPYMGKCFSLSTSNPIEADMDVDVKRIERHSFQAPLSESSDAEITLNPVADIDAEESVNHSFQTPVSQGSGAEISLPSTGICFPIEAGMDIAAKGIQKHSFQVPVSESSCAEISLNPIVNIDIYGTATGNHPFETPLSQSSGAEMISNPIDIAGTGTENYAFQTPISQSYGAEITLNPIVEEKICFKNKKQSKRKCLKHQDSEFHPTLKSKSTNVSHLNPPSLYSVDSGKEPVFLLQLLKCKKCDKSFLSEKHRELHQIVHVNEYSFKCNICEKDFSRFESLRLHQEVHTILGASRLKKGKKVSDKLQAAKRQRHDAQVSTLKSPTASENENNKAVHSDGGFNYKCDQCGEKFLLKENFEIHSKVEHQHLLKCKRCYKHFESSDALKSHEGACSGYLSTVSDQGLLHENQNICETSGFKFSSPSAMEEHMFVHATERSYQCSECDQTFVNEKGLRSHEVVHSDERPFLCGTCGKSFKSKSCLSAHERTHSKEDPNQCHLCDEKFSNLTKLKIHYLKHTKEQPYSCEICHKSFGLKKALIKHLIVHSAAREFLCEFCGRRFKSNGLLQRHRAIHLSGKEFTCDVCGKMFNFANSLFQHSLTHSDKRVHTCKLCGKKFKLPHRLRQHEKTHELQSVA